MVAFGAEYPGLLEPYGSAQTFANEANEMVVKSQTSQGTVSFCGSVVVCSDCRIPDALWLYAGVQNVCSISPSARCIGKD